MEVPAERPPRIWEAAWDVALEFPMPRLLAAFLQTVSLAKQNRLTGTRSDHWISAMGFFLASQVPDDSCILRQALMSRLQLHLENQCCHENGHMKNNVQM